MVRRRGRAFEEQTLLGINAVVGPVRHEHQSLGRSEAVLVGVVLPHRTATSVLLREPVHGRHDVLVLGPSGLRLIARVVVLRPVRDLVPTRVERERRGDVWYQARHRRQESEDEHGNGRARRPPRHARRTVLFVKRRHVVSQRGRDDRIIADRNLGGVVLVFDSATGELAIGGPASRDRLLFEAEASVAELYLPTPAPRALTRHPASQYVAEEPPGREIDGDEPERDQPLVPNDVLGIVGVGHDREGHQRREDHAEAVADGEGHDQRNGGEHNHPTVTAPLPRSR